MTKTTIKKLLFFIIIMILSLITLSACLNEQPVVPLPPDEVVGDTELVAKYDNLSETKKIVWNKIRNAKKYRVEFIGGDTYSDITDLYFDFDIGMRGGVTVNIIAYDSNGSELTKQFFAFAKLPMVNTQTINITDVGEEKFLCWDNISGVKDYQVLIDSQVTNVKTNQLQLSKADFNDKTIKIIPTKNNEKTSDGIDSYFAEWSAPLKVVLTQAVDSNKIIFDSKKVSWNTIDSATKYNVVVSQGGQEVYTTTVTKNFVDLYQQINIKKSFDISIKSVGKVNDAQNIYASSYPAAAKFEFFKPVDELCIENGILKWKSSDNCSSYILKLDRLDASGTIVSSEEKNVQENIFKELSPNEVYNISVLAKHQNAKYFTVETTLNNIKILSTPTISMERNGDNVSFNWAEIPSSFGYHMDVSLNGEPHFSQDTQDFFIKYNNFSSVGKYDIVIYAKGNETNILSSRISNTINVSKLAPITNLSSKYNDVTDKMDLTFKGASKFYRVGGDIEPIETEANLYCFKFPAKKTINVVVTAIGYGDPNIFDSEPETITITKLDNPSNLSLQGQTGVNWQSVIISKYDLILDSETKKFHADKSVSFTQLAPSGLSGGDHYIKVRCSNDEPNICPSEYVELKFKKCYTPSGLSVKNGMLAWNNSGDVAISAYKIQSANNEISILNIANNQYDLSEQVGKFSYDGTSLSVVAVGAFQKNILDSNASEVYTVCRLQAPKAAVKNSVLSWGDNANAIKYIVNDGSLNILDGKITSVNLLEKKLDNDKTYSFTIRAIGDKSKFFDSDNSNMVSVRVLKKPQITMQNSKLSLSNHDLGATNYLYNLDNLPDSVLITQFEPFIADPNGALTETTHIATFKAIGDGVTTINSTASRYEFTKLSMPNISMANNIIKFNFTSEKLYYSFDNNALTLSESYELQIKSDNFSAGSHVFNAKLGGDGVKTIDSNSKTYNFEKLEIKDLIMSQYMVSWNSTVQNYFYSINSSEATQTGQNSFFAKEFKNFIVGDNIFQVFAKGDGVNKIDSAKKSITIKKLVAPTIKIEKSNLCFSEIIDKNSGYKYCIFPKTEQAGEYIASQKDKYNLLSASLLPMEYFCNVFSIGDGSATIDSDVSINVSFTKLEPTTLSIKNKILKWSNVANSGYIISLLGEEITIAKDILQCDISQKVFTAEFNNILLTVCGDGVSTINSDSNTLQVIKLQAPTPKIQDSEFKFAKNNSAVSYEIEYNGTIKKQKENTLSLATCLTSAGSYKIKYRAIGNNENIFESEFSTEVAVTKLETPYGVNAPNKDKIQFECKVGNKFKYHIGGAWKTISEKSIDVSTLELGQHSLQLRVEGDATTTISSDSIEVQFTINNDRTITIALQ